MADQPNVFDVSPAITQEPVQSNPAPSDASYADLLSSIVNESGKPKYDSIPKALEGLANAQQYIPQLKTELERKEAELLALKAKLDQQASVEEVVARLTAQQQQAPAQDTPPQASGLDEQAVVNLVKNVLNQTKQQESAVNNTLKVQEALTAKFGDKTVEVLEAKARELGTTRQELGQLASQNPSLVLALFGTTANKAASPTIGSVNIPSSYSPERAPLEKPGKSLLSGATSKEQAEYMRKIKEDVYARHGVTTN